jgi:hypothetical protein
MGQAVQRAAAAAAMAGCAAVSSAQPALGPVWCVSCGDSVSPNSEPAVIASPANSSHVAMAWNTNSGAPGGAMRYAATIDGGNSAFHNQGPLLTPTSMALTDPMVGVPGQGSADLWLGGEYGGGQLFVARIPAGKLATEAPIAAAASGSFDKCLMAIGPCRGAGGCSTSGEAIYAVASQFVGFPGGPVSCRSGAGALGSAWNSPRQITGGGQGAFPVVIRHGPASGRLVVASLAGPHLPQPIVVVRSDDGGQTWAAAATQTQTAPAVGGVVPAGALTVDSQGATIGSVPEDQPFLGSAFRCNGFCSVATDPADTNRVLVAINGYGAGPIDSVQTLDVYLALSQDGGASFVSGGASTVYHVTDAMLRLPGETGARHTLLPTVTIDALGGVDLMVVRNLNGGDVGSIVLANWPSLNALAAGSPPRLLSLAGPFKDHFSAGGPGNDYFMVTSAGCYAWCAYAVQSDSGRSDVWVRRIELCGQTADLADFDRDSNVSPGDVAAFAAAFASGAAGAGAEGTHALGPQDAAAFMRAFGLAVGPGDAVCTGAVP